MMPNRGSCSLPCLPYLVSFEVFPLYLACSSCTFASVFCGGQVSPLYEPFHTLDMFGLSPCCAQKVLELRS